MSQQPDKELNEILEEYGLTWLGEQGFRQRLNALIEQARQDGVSVALKKIGDDFNILPEQEIWIDSGELSDAINALIKREVLKATQTYRRQWMPKADVEKVTNALIEKKEKEASIATAEFLLMQGRKKLVPTNYTRDFIKRAKEDL